MIVFAAISVSLYLLDLLTKALVRARMPLGSEIEILPFFSLVHLENTGIAFGFFQGKNHLFMLAGLIVMAAMVFLGYRMLRDDRFSAYAIATVIGGGLGNLTDRFLRGRVTDFLDFYWGAHHWPAFNVADSAICVGATLLILREFMHKKNVSRPV